MKNLLLLLLLFIISLNANSQQNINSMTSKDIKVNGNLEVNSTTIASKPCPVMSEVQRDTIASPLAGRCVYNSNTNQLNIYNGTIWKSAGGGISNWETSFNYAINDVIVESNKIYQCNTAHTSTVFASDIANWTILSNDLPIDLSSDVTGVLPMMNGGTDKNLTPVLGGVIYTDAGSMEILGAGTTGQTLNSNGASAPTWEDKSISAKAEDLTSVTLKELQFKSNQLTPTAPGKYLNESDNTNIAYNSGFEALTDNDGYTISGTGAFANETTASLLLGIGKKTGKMQCSSSTACSVSQTQNTLANMESFPALVSVKAQASGIDTEFCALVDDVEIACLPIGSKNTYAIPVIVGTTSIGGMVRQKSTASPLVVRYDDFKLDIKDNITSHPNIGPRVKYTPTFTGFGTVTVHDCYGQQVGTNEVIDCTFESGTTTAVEARVSLRSGLTTSSQLPTISLAGTLGRNVVNSSYSYSVLVEPSASYVTFGAGESARSLLSKVTASAVFVSTNLLSFKAVIPVNEYSATTPYISDKCKDQIDCVQELSFSRDTSNVISSAVPFGTSWAPTCTGTTTVVCDITSGEFTVTPVCFAVTGGSYSFSFAASSTSTTSVTFPVVNSSDVPNNLPLRVKCDRQGADSVRTQVNFIVAQLKDYNKTEGTTSGRVDDFSFVIHGGNLNTNCTSSPCSYTQIGDYVTGITRNGTGSYPTTFKKTYTTLICTLGPHANTTLIGPNGLPACTNCGSLVISVTAPNGALDTRLSVSCRGTY